MNVFIPYAVPVRVARVLDARRLNKQIIECDWLLNAKEGDRVFKHPAVQMWQQDKEWVDLYRAALLAYRDGDIRLSIELSNQAVRIQPDFFWFNPLFQQHRSRLYTKDPEHYAIFESAGKSDINFYIHRVGDKLLLVRTQNGRYLPKIDITDDIKRKRREFYGNI